MRRSPRIAATAPTGSPSTTAATTHDDSGSGTPSFTTGGNAVAAVHTLAQLTTAVWTNSANAGTPIRAVDVQQLRGALDPARAALGLPPLAYTDSTPGAATRIKAAHVQELRNGVK